MNWSEIGHEFLNTWLPHIVRFAQLLAASFTVIVWFKLRKIEKRYLFKAQHNTWSKQLTDLATDLRKNAQAIDEQIEHVYQKLAEAEAIVASIERAGLPELKTKVSGCNKALKEIYVYDYVIFKGHRRKPTADEIWKINAELHGLSTAVKDFGKELNWRA